MRKIKKTFVATLPDKSGEFLKAVRIIFGQGGNISRISYNKAIDVHTVFVDVKAEESDILKISEELSAIGCFENNEAGRILQFLIKVSGESGAIIAPLTVIKKYNINISYINLCENKSEFQYIKMAVVIENIEETIDFLNELATVSDVEILKNDAEEKNLDNTVFYISFTHKIRQMLELNQEQANEITVNSNKIMQRHEEENKNPYKTFVYIKRFAQFIKDNKGKNFKAEIHRKILEGGKVLYQIEPPCGSNTFVLEGRESFLFVDCGFACYQDEMKEIFLKTFKNFEKKKKILMITHCDIDHTGASNLFDEIYASDKTRINFLLEKEGKKGFREQSPEHQPYKKISEIITGYSVPDAGKIKVVKSDDTETVKITDKFIFEDMHFLILSGNGGHVPGEIMVVSEKDRLIFTGDIFVNIAGYSKKQATFNKFAPNLLPSVNTNSERATICRKYVTEEYKGYLACPGHGKWCIL